MMPRKILPILTLSVLLCACGNKNTPNSNVDSSTSTASESARPKNIDKFGGGYKMIKDKETGFMRPVSDKEGSPFGDKANQFKGNNGSFNKDFSKNNYDTKRWSAAKEKQSWKPWKKAKKEYDYSPQFIKDNAGLAKTSQERNKSFRRDPFSTSDAREQSATRIQNTQNQGVKRKKETFTPPPIISNQTYNNSGRSVEDVKGLLSE